LPQTGCLTVLDPGVPLTFYNDDPGYFDRFTGTFHKGNTAMSDNWKSQAITQGVARSPNRAMLRAVGFGDSDFVKPIVGVASAHSTITPCNMGIGPLATRAEAGVRAAGGMPQLFGTITISDGISMGTEGMKYSLVSRDVIADSIETVCSGQSLDRDRRLRQEYARCDDCHGPDEHSGGVCLRWDD
jgi:Dehydratase family